LALPVAARNGRFRFPKLNVVGSNPISRSNVSEATRRGIDLVTPDFNQPDFASLTISRMIAQASEVIAAAPEPVVLIGSSLGGFVAVQVAASEPSRVARVILLAPALDFSANRLRDLGDRGLDEWRRTDTLNVFHYGYGRMMPLRYSLYEDATRYDAFGAHLRQPMQIFQGTRDTAVDPDTVRRWAAARANVELHLLDDDHQLIASLETGAVKFLTIVADRQSAKAQARLDAAQGATHGGSSSSSGSDPLPAHA